MTTIRLYMSMSIDGYIAGPDDRPGQELGEGGGRLFNWLDDRNGPGINGDEPPGSARFYTEVAACAADARAAAGDSAVMVHGAGAAQALLRAGELDELELHVVPVLLGAGRRLFDNLDGTRTELELVRHLEGRDATHQRYRVRH